VHCPETENPLRLDSERAFSRPGVRHGRRGRFSFARLGAPAILGVLNVTPDSFSDGGRFLAPEDAVSHARGMARAGAALIDVGGESTRPGARPVDAREEIRRVLPVIEKIRGLRPISIDTTKARVAERALAAGAELVNDVSAGADPRMLGVVAERGAAIILMHRKGTPRTMRRRARYRDVVEEVKRFLSQRIEAALRAGVRRDAIAVDPGIGFAKDLGHNLELLARVDEIVALGFPVVVGASRKSFLGRLLGARSAEERVEGTIAASLLAVAAGAVVVRVHDVAPMARALRVAEAIWGVRRR
jgi:dihydropteroate synthase